MRPWLIYGSILAFLSVLTGAMGAHALKPLMDEEAVSLFNTAIQYQMWHAIALMLLGIFENCKLILPKTAKYIGVLFLAGILLFSGNLYFSAIIGNNPFHFLIPIGGGMFLLGWLVLILSIYKTKN